MATFYLDPVGGNDANDGTTFANRWQSFTTGASAARIAAGDTIRVIASTDPTSMAQNASWATNSASLTLTTAVTENIYLSGTWTAAATNVTITTSTSRKIGTNTVSISPNATFTTGKAAYKTLTSTDFSAYQQVSFWASLTSGVMTADGDLSIRLCSDTTGDVTVNTIPIPRIKSAAWHAFTVNLGAALGSAIQSVALYVEVDRAAQTILLNNILACKAASADDSLTLTSLVGKNTGTECWMGLQSINGTALILEVYPQQNQPLAGLGGYPGNTGSAAIYKREQLNLPSAFTDTSAGGTLFGAIQDSGTSGNVITFSGGWNRTDMSTQTGDTYINGVSAYGSGFSITTKNYITIDKINLTRFATGITIGGTSSNINITAKDVSNVGTSATAYGNSISYLCTSSTFNIDNIINGFITSGGSSLTYRNIFNVVTMEGNISLTTPAYSATTSSQAIFNEVYNITNFVYSNRGTNSNSPIILNGVQNSIINIGRFEVKGDYGIILGNSGSSYTIGTSNNVFNFTTQFAIINYSASAVAKAILLTNANDNIFNFNGVTPAIQTTSTAAGGGFIKSVGDSSNIFQNVGAITLGNNQAYVEMTEGSMLTFVNSDTVTPTGTGVLNRFNGAGSGSIKYANYALDTTDQRIYYFTNVGTVLTDATTRHTASGVSWKMSVSSTTNVISPTVDFPLSLPIAKVACNASALVTASVWVYRTDTNLVTKLVCPGGQITGVSTTSASAAGAINTWEQLTITFTPTQQGVVCLEVQCYGAVADVYVDDFSVSQA